MKLKEEMNYFIRVDGQEVPVTQAVYKAYCHGARKERYFREGDQHNHVYSYDALDTEEYNGSDLFADEKGMNVESQVERRLALEELSQALGHLNEDELELIRRLYLYDQSLRQVAAQKQIPVTTLQYRHQQILKKLKKYFVHTFAPADE